MKTAPVDLSKLSDIVENGAVKKEKYDELVEKVNVFDTTGLAKKSDYNTKTKDIEDKIPNLAITTALNAKINEVKGEIPSITGLATTTALNNVKNNIPDITNLVQKADYDTNISEIENKLDREHDKSILTQKFNKLMPENSEGI